MGDCSRDSLQASLDLLMRQLSYGGFSERSTPPLTETTTLPFQPLEELCRLDESLGKGQDSSVVSTDAPLSISGKATFRPNGVVRVGTTLFSDDGHHVPTAVQPFNRDSIVKDAALTPLASDRELWMTLLSVLPETHVPENGPEAKAGEAHSSNALLALLAGAQGEAYLPDIMSALMQVGKPSAGPQQESERASPATGTGTSSGSSSSTTLPGTPTGEVISSPERGTTNELLFDNTSAGGPSLTDTPAFYQSTGGLFPRGSDNTVGLDPSSESTDALPRSSVVRRSSSMQREGANARGLLLFKEDGSLNLQFFKVFLCKNESHVHDRKNCPFYHSQRDRRRPPVTYRAEQCEDCFDVEGEFASTCPKGDECPKCHNRHELLYHPSIYKQRFCSSYNHLECHRGRFCAFAHTRSEIGCELFLEEEERQPGSEFFMKKFKTLWCPYGIQHDWHGCLYAHTYQDCRRSPVIGYGSEPCPYWQKDLHSADYQKRCPFGPECPYSHGSKEQLYHPAYYKTMPCADYKSKRICPRRELCAFFHDLSEKRSGDGLSMGKAYDYANPIPNSSMQLLQVKFMTPPLFNLDDFEAFGHASHVGSTCRELNANHRPLDSPAVTNVPYASNRGGSQNPPLNWESSYLRQHSASSFTRNVSPFTSSAAARIRPPRFTPALSFPTYRLPPEPHPLAISTLPAFPAPLGVSRSRRGFVNNPRTREELPFSQFYSSETFQHQRRSGRAGGEQHHHYRLHSADGHSRVRDQTERRRDHPPLLWVDPRGSGGRGNGGATVS